MAAKKRTTNAELLGKLTDIASKHDRKLAHDYQAIKRLEKDTDEVTKNVGTLSVTVGTLSGTVKTQASMVNGVLAVTVIAFLGFVVQSVLKPSPESPDPRAIAESLITVIRSEVSRQIPGSKTATSGRPHATASKTATNPRP